MNRKHLIIIAGFLSLTVSCNQGQIREKAQLEELVIYEKQKIEIDSSRSNMINSYFEEIVSDSKTPQLAKDLINNYVAHEEEPLAYFEMLKSKDKKIRAFYFKALTNTLKYAEGSYADELGKSGKEYIENNTADFTSFFDNSILFSRGDLETWAEIVMLDSSIVSENDRNSIDDFIKQLRMNCVNCSETQKSTIAKFDEILKIKVQENIDNFSN